MLRPAQSDQNPLPREFPARGFYRARGKWILIVVLLLAPVYLAISGKVLSPGDMSAYLLDVAHWLPKRNQLIKDMQKFSEVVGKERGSIVRISWPGCREDDPRLERFASILKSVEWPEQFSPSTTGASESSGSRIGIAEAKTGTNLVFEDVLTLPTIAEQMRQGDSRLTDQQIDSQLRNIMVGEDGTTCIMATLSSREPEERAFAVNEIYRLADDTYGLSEEDIRLFGGPVYTKQLDDTGIRLAALFTPLSAIVSIICVWFCLRTMWVVLAVFLTSILCTCAALVSLYITQAVMDPLLMLLPGFWFIMSISTSIHFVNYYFDIRDQFGGLVQGDNSNSIDLAAAAAAVALRPSLLATLTTCVGLASLCTNEVLPLWRFGFHASIGLICSFVTCFLFLPAWLNLTARKLEVEAKRREQRGGKFWNSYARFSNRLSPKVVAGFIVLLVVTALGFSRLEFSNKLSDQFASSSPVNADAEWFEDRIGPLLPFEILVRFPHECELNLMERLEYVNDLQSRIDSLSVPCKTLSATSVVPISEGYGARQTVRRVIYEKRLGMHAESLRENGFIVEEPATQLWRISVFSYNSENVSMNDYFGAIQAAVAEQIDDSEIEDEGPTVSYAGIGSRMAVITRELGGGLMRSCFTSAILISLIVIVALRSVTLGLTAMLPNIFPIVVSFGAFGFLQPRLDIGSIMTASIAMGIAVDDTIHFMYWFNQGISDGLSRADSIRLAIKRCGRAIASTSIICGCGFVVFAFCDFMPAVRFGLLLFIMLGAALVGDLLFLPALLRSLPGRWIERRSKAQIKTAASKVGS